MFSKKDKLVLKCIIGTLAIASIALIVYYVLDSMIINADSISYFNQHFNIMLCLFLVGIIALLLPMAGKQKFGDGKGDSMMIVVGFLLMLCGIISVIYSYLNF